MHYSEAEALIEGTEELCRIGYFNKLNKMGKRKEMKQISKRLDDVKFYHMETEVIYSALKIMKDNPEKSILDAFDEGCLEWDI